MMIGILEMLILTVVVPVVILIFALVFHYVSRNRGSLLFMLAGLAMAGLLLFIFLGLFYVRTESRSATLVQQSAVLDSELEAIRQDTRLASHAVPETNEGVTEIPGDALQKHHSENQPLVAPKPGDPHPSRIVNKVEIGNASPKPAKSVSTELPDWVKEGVKTAVLQKNSLINNSRPVFQSGLFATRDEALQDALAKATQQMQADLMMREPWLKNNLRELDLELFRHTAYRRPYFQMVEHDFGDVLKSGESLKHDMFRAYVEIENTPGVRHQLLARWKQKIGNERSFWVGGAFGLITLMCIGAAIYLRTDSSQDTIHSSH
ncbi:hypothetical protein [Gimesia sp.]|uniref:hypothetical protein n=1 Tax=Gimesia sp. TaxID=2024833 RepID=UPI003A94F75F